MGVPVNGFPEYTIDSNGNVFSTISNKYLKPSRMKTGYLTVELFRNGKSKRVLIHRLVADAFIPNPYNYPQVNHKDENKENNHVDNLEWCTAKYNMNYGEASKTRHLKIDYSNPIFAINAKQNGKKTSRSVIQYDKQGNYITEYESAKEASRITGINHSHIIECCKGKRYKTVGGFIWKYNKKEE